MTSYKTMENLKDLIKNIVKDERLSTKNCTGRVPQVILGYLKPLEADQEEKEDFPYILIRYMDGENDQSNGKIKLKLIFGVYSKDSEGWIDVLHLMEVVKRELLKKQVFDFYTLDYPIKTSIPEEQPYPYFYGFMDIEFNIPKIEFEGDERTWMM